MELAVFQFVLLGLSLAPREDSGSVFFTFTHQVFILINKILLRSSSLQSALRANAALSLSSHIKFPNSFVVFVALCGTCSSMLFMDIGDRAGHSTPGLSQLCWVEEKDLLSPSAGSDQPKAAQEPVGLVCDRGTLMAGGQLGVHQDPWVLLCQAAFQLASPWHFTFGRGWTTETHLQSGDMCFVKKNKKLERMQKPTQIWARENASKRAICSAHQQARVAACCVCAPAVEDS